jgi:hypothetical protein
MTAIEDLEELEDWLTNESEAVHELDVCSATKPKSNRKK